MNGLDPSSAGCVAAPGQRWSTPVRKPVRPCSSGGRGTSVPSPVGVAVEPWNEIRT